MTTHARGKGRGAGSWLLIACAGCAVAGGVIGGVIANAINSPSSSSGSSASGVPASTSSQTQSSCAVTQVAQKVLPLINAVQTDAAINPGNSGGAMVDCAGKFVGIPSAGATVPSESGESGGGSIGLGFAIPADFAIPAADEIISTGRVTHAYMGIQVTAVAANAAKVNGTAEGLIVKGIDSGGPAAAAGLAVGDVITSVNGQPAVSTDQLAELTLTKSPGDKVQLGYTRGGASRTATLTLAAQP